MDAQGFTSHAYAISDFGPHGQVRAEFRTTEGARIWQVDVVAYFVDSIGLTRVVVDARTGPQVTADGIRLIGRRPSERAATAALSALESAAGHDILVYQEHFLLCCRR